MVKLKVLVVCILIVAVDVAAGILGIQAEAAQNKAIKHLRLGILDCRYRLWMFKCRDPRREAIKLALGAAMLLSLAHVVTNLLGGCMHARCRGESEEPTLTVNFHWHVKLDHISRWIVDAGDRDVVKQEIQGVPWFQAASFLGHRRDFVLRPWAVFCCVLRCSY
ncbi:Oxygen-evolving enhancer protein 3-1 [Hibiscus syriacus]|uniref:Oxygen-evolving enhancer protein 3-1 n=1 Tax=Hibiscus syriacus TaxID=106335 RepID=A0A6A2ZF46_HIBSY|nr:Oxygen-evolving enhancer protein 3-1 [Hibiscus syriacus]